MSLHVTRPSFAQLSFLRPPPAAPSILDFPLTSFFFLFFCSFNDRKLQETQESMASRCEEAEHKAQTLQTGTRRKHHNPQKQFCIRRAPPPGVPETHAIRSVSATSRYSTPVERVAVRFSHPIGSKGAGPIVSRCNSFSRNYGTRSFWSCAVSTVTASLQGGDHERMLFFTHRRRIIEVVIILQADKLRTYKQNMERLIVAAVHCSL